MLKQRTWPIPRELLPHQVEQLRLSILKGLPPHYRLLEVHLPSCKVFRLTNRSVLAC